MIKNFKKINNFLPQKYKKKFYKLISLSFILNFFELFSIALIIPIIQIIFFDSNIENNFINTAFNLNLKINADQIFYLFIFIYLTKLFISYLIIKYRESFTFKLNFEISKQLLILYLSQPLNFFKAKNSSELVKNLITESWQACGGFIRPYVVLISEIMLVIVLIAFLLKLYFFYTIIFITFIVTLSYLFFRFYKNNINSLSKTRVISEEKTIRSYIESIGAIKEIKIFEKINFFIKNFITNKHEENSVRQKVEVFSALPRIFYEFVLLVILIIFFVFMKFENFNTENFTVLLTAFFAVFLRLLPSFTKINQSVQACGMYLVSLDLISNQFKELNNEYIESKNLKEFKFSSEIKIINISHRYGSNKIFTNFSYDLKKGDYLGISGESGSGKSTLANLIIGFEEPNNGEILADNINIKNNLVGWYRNFGVVHQSNFFLNETIEKNITLQNEDLNLDEKSKIKEILINLNLEKFVPQFNKFRVGERASKLSQGERQRLAIARVLYKDISILVLDEATSNLDKDNEELILKKIKTMNDNGLTVIHISHDENALKNANKKINL